ncbi:MULTISPECIES: hypothetical protein [unclassified Mesorhizobium]|uniref:hypothetical protein n=1 Tax=unclassified Mesorhizobium TaxID=325217 RepID=UPI00167AC10E|nr:MULTISPECIES: hypothetical protein [unclassified Mesorhizobium]
MNLNVIDLFSSTQFGASEAWAISTEGVVVASALNSPGLVWIPDTPNGLTGNEYALPAEISPGLRPVSSSQPLGINSQRIVVGVCSTVDFNNNPVDRAFSYTPGDSFLVDLGTFDYDPVTGVSLGTSSAYGINGAGQIVGTADDANGVKKAFLRQPGIGQVLTDVLPSNAPSEGLAIGDRLMGGRATFFDPLGNSMQQAFSYDVVSGALTPLGTLVVDPFTGRSFGASRATGVSRIGNVAGVSESPPIITVGVLFNFPTIPLSAVESEARAAAEVPSGVMVVGRFWPTPGGPSSGFVYDTVSGFQDLNAMISDPDWHIDNATGVNEQGQICAIGSNTSGASPRGLLLSR